MGVATHDWLQTQVARGHIPFGYAHSAELWASDIAELTTILSHRRVDRGRSTHNGAEPNLMLLGLKRRVMDTECRLGGQESISYKLAYGVAVQGLGAGELAERFQIRTATAADMIRLSLQVVHDAYAD